MFGFLKRLARRPKAERTSEIDELKAILRRFEGCHLKAYRCPTGTSTIGVGATRTLGGQPIPDGMRISQEQADAMLDRDANASLREAVGMLRGDASRGARIAFASLVFNFGAPRIRKSQAVANYNDGNLAEAERHFKEWRLGSGKPLRGLVRRRSAEWKLVKEDER